MVALHLLIRWHLVELVEMEMPVELPAVALHPAAVVALVRQVAD
jgi:hypothetical protein